MTISLSDVKKAFDDIPAVGQDTKFAGTVLRDKDVETHIQGAAAYQDVLLLTHSDRSRKSGRILVVRRQGGAPELIAEHCLPIVSLTKPFYFHAGGCQLLGDCLVVPVETGSGASSILFLDVTNPLDIREVDPTARVSRSDTVDARDAGAAGITTFTRSNGDKVCLLGVYDNGKIDFYATDRSFFPRNFAKITAKPVTVTEKEHQGFCLFSETAEGVSRVFAIGLNKTATGDDTLVLYEVNPDTGAISKPLSEKQLTTTGGVPFFTRPHLRWGAGLEIVSTTGLSLHCTSHDYDAGCHINVFDPRLPAKKTATGPTKALKSARARTATKARRAKRAKRATKSSPAGKARKAGRRRPRPAGDTQPRPKRSGKRRRR